MKMIHCADLHLDSKMTANLNEIKANERKQELLKTFQNMIFYANQNEISAILISGDLFDSRNVLRITRNIILGEIRKYSHITFYYLKGNHDNFYLDWEELPENLILFGDEWMTYAVTEEIQITGVEISTANVAEIYDSLVLDQEKINIVMLHGQDVESTVANQPDWIDLRKLRNKGIDYLALGHIHSYRKGILDGRGEYCYPGCLEGRGFDECGTHGFVLLNIDEEQRQIEAEFIPFSKRNLYVVEVDVSGCMDSVEMIERVRTELKKKEISEESLVKVILEGEVDVESEMNTAYISMALEEMYYFLKLVDQTKFAIHTEEYLYDISLRGEFIRTVQAAEELSREDRNTVIRYGLQILNGEEVG